jgi:serine/threonine-protein kinase HipA
MVFNLVAGNHGRYRLAPAFDLVIQLGANTGYQLLAILPGKAESSLGLARQAAAQFGLSESQAEKIIGNVRETVKRSSSALLTAHGAEVGLVRQVREFLEKQDERIAAA